MEQTTNSPTPVAESRKNLVKELNEWFTDTRNFWEPQFERMREAMRFAGGDQWGEHDTESPRYKVNFVQRQLNQDVASVYARNPTVTIERKQRLDHRIWDGTTQQLQQAKMELEAAAQQAAQGAAMGGEVPAPPEAAAKIVLDYAAGRQRKMLLDKIAKTLELLITFEMDEQRPSFDSQMKSLALREKVCGVGFLTVKFQRETETVQTSTATTAGVVEKMQAIQARVQEMQADPSYGEDAACHEEVRLMVATLNAQLANAEAKVLREGVVFDFKPATSVLVDPECRSLHEFVGANRVAEFYFLSPERVLAQYKVDVRNEGTVRYGEELKPLATGGESGKPGTVNNWPKCAKCCVVEIYDKRAQMKYVICDGYEDFLEEPETPWPAVKGFWPIVALKFQRVEVDRNEPKDGVTIYGQSSVELVKPMQEEMNRSQQGLREHRVANRPNWFFPDGTLDPAEADKLGSMPAHTGMALKNVPPGTDIRTVLMSKPTVPIDPSLYRTDVVMQHVFLAVGSQAANLGQQNASDKATGQAIAEQSRVTGVSSEVDEEDKFLTEVMRIAGEMLLQAMTEEGVQRKVGMGAVWPKQSRDPGGEQAAGIITKDDCLEQFVIKIEAASSGRANQALDIQNFKEMWPSLLAAAQALGLSLEPLLKEQAKILQFKFDLEEWLASGLQNAMGAAAAGLAGAPPGPGGPPQPGAPVGAAPDPAGMRQRIAQTGGPIQ